MTEFVLIVILLLAVSCVLAVLFGSQPSRPSPDAFWREAERMCRSVEEEKELAKKGP